VSSTIEKSGRKIRYRRIMIRLSKITFSGFWRKLLARCTRGIVSIFPIRHHRVIPNVAKAGGLQSQGVKGGHRPSSAEVKL